MKLTGNLEMHYERYPIASPWIIPHPRHLLPLEKPAQLWGLLLWEQDERHEGEPEAEERRGSDTESWKKEECLYMCARARIHRATRVLSISSRNSVMLERCTQHHEEKREDESSVPETRVL
ncbi:uncharacterized protein LOC116414417 [Apis florea]|uniref:uncharacterized protein LOC116414417 n=1 Tax=Apis florea TaxID=7463 RepID=UPI0012FE8DC2|nr:uncharacterized protein LOC116414417 [Apis florea]